MKSLAKTALCYLYKYSGLMHTQEAVSRWLGKHFATVVVFHRVTDDIPPDGLTVTTAWFRGFCRLIQRKFRVVPLREICRLVESGEKPRRRTVAITFDDCYRDNLFAARVLAEHGLPATFFVPTSFVGANHEFFWDRGLSRMATLNWDEVREMAGLGHDIGSHTATHPDMGQLTAEDALRELTQSREAIAAKVGTAPRHFAFPFGDAENCPDWQYPLVREAGYEGCFSAVGGFIRPGMNGVLPRWSMPQFRSLINLELHLTGCLEWMYRLKKKAGLTPPWQRIVLPTVQNRTAGVPMAAK